MTARSSVRADRPRAAGELGLSDRGRSGSGAHLPRGFAISAEDDLAFLNTLPQFDRRFLNQLRNLRFTGDVWAPPEGTIVYPHEPLIQVIAPLPEAQIVETALINQIAYPTLVASKAARAVDAAAGRPVIEFGGRRAHGSEAAVEASRATYIAGFEATSSVEAGRRYAIPTTGTMAHSFVLAEGDEASAFDAFASRYPDTTLLVDTFDTRDGVINAIKTAKKHGPGSVGAIRIDSGDLRDRIVAGAHQTRHRRPVGRSDRRQRRPRRIPDRGAGPVQRTDRHLRLRHQHRRPTRRGDARLRLQDGRVPRADLSPSARPANPASATASRSGGSLTTILIARFDERPTGRRSRSCSKSCRPGNALQTLHRHPVPDARSSGQSPRSATGGDRSLAAKMKSETNIVGELRYDRLPEPTLPES